MQQRSDMKTAIHKKQLTRGERVKLTPHVFGFRKMVMGELLYFGYDEVIAEDRAARVMLLAADLKQKGIKRWPAPTLTLAKAIAKGQEFGAVGVEVLAQPKPEAAPDPLSQPSAGTETSVIAAAAST